MQGTYFYFLALLRNRGARESKYLSPILSPNKYQTKSKEYFSCFLESRLYRPENFNIREDLYIKMSLIPKVLGMRLPKD